jgi:hypothetical protein
MAINLQELRAAVQSYVDSSVKVKISDITPQSGTQLGPNEEFTFNVSADNTIAGSNAIRLINVRYHIKLSPTGAAKLLAPNSTTVLNTVRAFNNPQGTGAPFALNQPVDEMYVFSTSAFILDRPNELSPGDIDTITGLKGKAGSAPGGGTTNIQARVLADPDLDYLFPKDQDTATATKVLNIVG